MAAVLFGNSLHPLDPSEDKQEVLEQLGSLAPEAALREITGLVSSVAYADSLPLDQRIKLVRQLEDAALRHSIPCSREYLTSPHRGEEGRAEEFRLWRTNREFWAQLAAAYNSCFNAYLEDLKEDALHKVELTRLMVRLLRAYGTRLKWDQFRYGPYSEALWQTIGRAYMVAVANRVDRRLVSAYPGRGRESTVEHEYLKVLAFQASSMDSLLPLEIEIADKLIVHFLPLFAFGAERGEEHGYWIDPSQRRGPARLVRQPPESEAVRYFGAGRALSGLLDLQQVLERGAPLPSDLDLGRAYSARVVLPVVRHLADCWAQQQPRREFDRYKVSSRLIVISGLERIHQRLTQKPASAESGADGAEWVVDNVSRSGMAVHLPATGDGANSPVQIGTLLGLQPEGGESWLVGVVRRVARENDALASIGVETLTKKAVPLDLGDQGRNADALLLDTPDPGETVRVALPTGAMAGMAPRNVAVDDKSVRLVPMELIERGVAFDLARYRVEPAA